MLLKLRLRIKKEFKIVIYFYRLLSDLIYFINLEIVSFVFIIELVNYNYWLN